MSQSLLISVEDVASTAFAPNEYVAPESITLNHIRAVQERYIIPIIGESLSESVAQGLYVDLYDEYIHPVMCALVRIEANIEAYPSDKAHRRTCHTLLRALSNHLNGNQARYPEYSAAENVMNRCSLVGGVVC